MTILIIPTILYTNKCIDGESTLRAKVTVSRGQCEPGTNRLQRKFTPEQRVESRMASRQRRYPTVIGERICLYGVIGWYSDSFVLLTGFRPVRIIVRGEGFFIVRKAA